MTIEFTSEEAKVVTAALEAYRDRMVKLANEDEANGFNKFAREFRGDAQTAVVALSKVR